MRFAEPIWLLIGAAVVLVSFVLLVRAERLRARALALLSGARLLGSTAVPSRARRWLRIGAATLAIAMGFTALARPQRGTHWETVTREGIDLMLVVDTSRSMDADDVKPTRLARTKLAIRDLVERFPGDRIGLIAFAGDAFVASPMTLDHPAVLETLDGFDTSVVARGGTNVGRAIDVAVATLAAAPARQKVAVLLTDGEDLEGHGLEEAKRAADAGVTIDTVGVGTRAGEIVPARDATGAIVGVVRGEDGAPVRSHLDEAGLLAIAEATHGAYLPLGQDGLGLDRLYEQSLRGLAHIDASSRMRRVYDEWFQLPLGLALVALVVESLLGRRWSRGSRRFSGSRGGAVAVSAAALLLLIAPRDAHASVESAAKAYAAGRFEEAAKEFEAARARNPSDARLGFNAGDAAYRSGQYEAAAGAFESAMAHADPALQERILYNEGNTRYRLGQAQVATAPAQAIDEWKKSLAHYDGALALDPADADARFNRDFVKRKLAELEQQQAQKPPTPKDQDQKDKEKEDKKDGGKDPKSGGKADSQKSDGGPKDGSGKGSKKPDQGEGRDSGQKRDEGQKGDRTQGDQGGEHKGADAKPKGTGETPDPRGAGQAPRADGTRGDHGSEEGGSTPGQLSAGEARALLKSLRGDEHHGVKHGSGVTGTAEDVPGKDW